MAHTEKCRGCRNENRCDFIHCTSEREKEIRAKAIEEFAVALKEKCKEKMDVFGFGTLDVWEINKIANELKGE